MMSRWLNAADVDNRTQVKVYLNYQSDPTPWVEGEVIAYSDTPMALIRRADGSTAWVNCSLRWEPA